MSDGPLDFLAPTVWIDESRRFLHVGTRRWPVIEVQWDSTNLPESETTLDWPLLFETRRAHVRFENGWGASIIYGSCTYSENHDHGGAPYSNPVFVEEPREVEVAVLYRTEMPTDPIGYMRADEVNQLLDILHALPSDFETGRRELMARVVDSIE